MKKIIVIVVMVMSLFVSAPANAGDGTPGGISAHEYYAVQRGTMNEVQHFLEVENSGKVVIYQNHGQNITKQYPWYGHSTGDGFFQIAYSLNSKGQYMSGLILWYDFTGDGYHDPSHS
jgi:hypothetical protein